MQGKPLLSDLSHLLEAGIAPADAIARLHNSSTEDGRLLTQLRHDLQHVRSLAASLSASGFASRLESEISRTAEVSDKLCEELRLVSDRLEGRRARTRSLRVRMWLANFVLLAALAIQLVRATTVGIPLSTALIGPGIILLTVVGASQLLVGIAARDSGPWLSIGQHLGLHKSSVLFRQFFEQTFYTLFMWQADAGLDYAAAAKTLSPLVDCRSYRLTVERYRQKVAHGSGVTDALCRVNLLVPGELQQVVKVGEQSGQLAAALRRYLTRHGEHLERVTTNLYTWLPRIYCIIVLAICAGSMI